MKNLETNNKYCVNCETWIFDNNKPKYCKFRDLVSLEGKQNVVLKDDSKAQIQLPHSFIPLKFDVDITATLELKLVYFNSLLKKEDNVQTITSLVSGIKDILLALESLQRLKQEQGIVKYE